VHADVVDRQDVRVIKRARGLRFAGEPALPHRIGSRPRQHFDRDLAIQPRIARPIHLAHSTGADDAHDHVRNQNGLEDLP
jgi:hypothetical protein